MNRVKSRAKAQAQYARETYTGTIVGKNTDGGLTNSYDVQLLGEPTIIKKVPNASQINFDEGTLVTLTRLSRLEFQLTGKSYMG
jgi:hypothetical protein